MMTKEILVEGHLLFFPLICPLKKFSVVSFLVTKYLHFKYLISILLCQILSQCAIWILNFCLMKTKCTTTLLLKFLKGLQLIDHDMW